MAEDEIHIIHGGGMIRATASSVALSAKFATGVAIRPPAIDLLSPDIEIFNPKKLGRLSGAFSALSGQPAIVYKRRKLEIALTPMELIRMVLRNLRPSEVKVLRDRFGDIDEIAPLSRDVEPDKPRNLSTWQGFLERIRGLAK